jgi:hypothetical protein
LQERVIGATYHTDFERDVYLGKPWQHLTRFEQIARHVTRNKVVDWIAVDNDSKGWPNNQRHRLVLTQDDIGLGEEAAQQELANALLRLKQNEL